MWHTRFSFPYLLAAALLAATATSASAQESLQAVRALYASAAYEDALAMVTSLRGADDTPEVAQVRVFCLIALGRTGEAEKVIEAVVTAHPLYVPDPAETSPRIQEAFTRARRQLLPDLARRLYLDGKSALDRKDRGEAVTKFESVIQLIDGFGNAEGTVAELRMLAAGFLDLSRARLLPEAESEKLASPLQAVSTASAADSSPEIARALAIKQQMPLWLPADAVSQKTQFVGSIRVTISATGKVESAEIVRPVHPRYDRALLLAARSWEYQPARQNGVAVPSEQIVEVRLTPRGK